MAYQIVIVCWLTPAGPNSNVRKYIRERIQANDDKQPICQLLPTSMVLAFMMTQSPEKRTATKHN